MHKRAVLVGAGLVALATAAVVGASVSGADPVPDEIAAGVKPIAEATAVGPAITVQPLPDPVSAPPRVPPSPSVPPPPADVMTRPLVDVEGCAVTGVYELASPIPTDIVGLYVDPANAGGPAAALRGDLAAVAVADPAIEAMPGATYSVWETGEPLMMGTKRVAESDVGALSASVEDATASLPAGLIAVEPAFGGATVYGSACEVGGDFYGVEVVVGSLADRTWWLLNTDPVASSDDGDVTVALYTSAGVSDFKIRQADEAEWAALTEQVASSAGQGGLDG